MIICSYAFWRVVFWRELIIVLHQVEKRDVYELVEFRVVKDIIIVCLQVLHVLMRGQVEFLQFHRIHRIYCISHSSKKTSKNYPKKKQTLLSKKNIPRKSIISYCYYFEQVFPCYFRQLQRNREYNVDPTSVQSIIAYIIVHIIIHTIDVHKKIVHKKIVHKKIVHKKKLSSVLLSTKN